LPFTPYHLGPALAIGLPLRKYIHAPTFILANVIVDVEGLLVLVLGLNYPLHGYLHTFLLASLFGVALAVVMFFLERFLQPVYKAFLLETDNKPRLSAFVVAGVLGTVLHVLFDAPLYTDIQPFYPLTTANPLLNTVSSANVYAATIWLGVLGIVFYVGLLVFHAYGKVGKAKGTFSAKT
jgi:Flp pilus assembly protein protease CpaA